jgi:hypothetical protein
LWGNEEVAALLGEIFTGLTGFSGLTGFNSGYRIQGLGYRNRQEAEGRRNWIPAFAGMTRKQPPT